MARYSMRSIVVGTVLLISFLFLPIYPIYAGDSSTSSATSSTTVDTRYLKKDFEQRKENIQLRKDDFKDRMASKEADLKTRLQNFRDKTKAQIIERINKSLAEINKRVTDRFNAHLGRLSNILDRLDKVVQNSNSQGKDTSQAKTAIDQARSKIDIAKAAVSSQSAKEYIIVIADEKTAKADVVAKRQQLHSDLKATYDIVKDAREAVVNALKTTVSILEGFSSLNHGT